MSNAGPLTEPFTAPASCKTDTGVYMVKTSYSVQASNYVAAPFIGGPYDTINCLPSGYNPARSSYYSPAPSCPSGFTTACSNTNVAGTVTETVNTCCPTGLVYSCLSVSDKRYRPGTYPWQATLACLSDFPSATWTRTSITFVDGTTTTVQPTVSGSGGGIGAHGIAIRFQSSDLITSSTSSISSTSSLSLTAPSSTAPSSTAPSSTAPSSTEPSIISSSSSGVSTGAAAGIGVGAGAVVLLVALLLFWLVRRRRQRKKNGATPIPSPKYEGEYKGPQSLSTPATTNQGQYSSLPRHDQIAELGTSDHQVHEIDGPQRHEML